MAITTMDQLLAALESGSKTNATKISTTSEGAGLWHSLWSVAGYPAAGAVPATGSGAVPVSTTLGTIPFTNPTAPAKKYIARINAQGSTTGTLVIYDRLWHNSGLVGNIITSQAVNSVALTRYTTGVGVEVWGEVYAAMGATGSVLSLSYTDSLDQPRIGTYTHPANALSVGQMFPFSPPIAAVGIKSIQSVILSISTGTAGSFGLVLARRIAEIPLTAVNISNVLDSFSLGLPEIQPNAALSFQVSCTTTNTGLIMGTIDIIEG